MKIAVIKKQDSSFWRSCQSITENLVKSYKTFSKSSGHQLEVLNFRTGANALESHDLAKLAIEKGFETIVWLDHYTHPNTFIKSYIGHRAELKNKTKLPHFVFHLFGDFILQAPMWLEVEKDLAQLSSPVPFSFICASHKQAQLVTSLLKENSSYEVAVVPFPVDEDIFSFREEARLRLRQEMKLAEDELALLYTGRLSHQKNIIELIYGLSQYQKTFNAKTKLFLSGPMDDLGVPYLGKEALDGTFYFHWEEALNEHQHLLKEGRINYLGNLSHSELSDLYSASDLFVSLSCHNDEDYGMSPAEALCCGLPSVLSDWGGYASFKNYCPDSVHLVPVLPGDSRHEFRHSSFVKGLVALEGQRDHQRDYKVDNKSHHEKRESQSELAKSHLGVIAVAFLLNSFYENNHNQNVNFLGFNGTFLKLCALFENNPQAPFRSPSGGFSLFYKNLYQCYWQNWASDNQGAHS